MASNLVTVWLVSLLAGLSPADKATAGWQLPGWVETAAERTARYESIASDLYEVVYEMHGPVLYAGPKGRARTAALAIAIAWHESRFDKDVDKGPCYRNGKHYVGRCDGGMSACIMQVNVGTGKTPEGWTRDDLFADRKKCFTRALRIAESSFRACRTTPDSRLNMYASGRCSEGEDKGRIRLNTARRIFVDASAPDDAAFILPTTPPASPLTMLQGPFVGMR